ncbi:phage tail protein [Canibacter oris]|uniref:Phage tail protein n=1 Tax=Canibacter oris TaxID=1365628 RepID=A0A840DR28_9MICO|nr:phage tail protein [Canibacter oris]MBB4071626.1 hypothetical protein [Canibacter oris]
MSTTTTNNAANVSVGKPKAAGGIYFAPAGTTLPNDAKTALKSQFQGLGLVSEDGLTNSIEKDSSDIKDWSGQTVLKIVSGRTETFEHTFIETNEHVMKQVYGPANVSGDITNGLTVLHNDKELPTGVYVYEILLTGGRVKRIVIPNGQITEIGEVVYQSGEPIGYRVVITAYPDAAGNAAYEYIASLAS